MKRILLGGLLLAALSGALPLVCFLLPRTPQSAVQDIPPSQDIQATAPPQTTPEPAVPSTDYLEPLLIWDGDAQVVRTVEVLDYLIGAAASEMPADWPAQAIQAQMVASHSWALYCRDHRDGSNGGAYFTASPQRREGYMTPEVMQAYWGDAYEENYNYFSQLAQEVLDWVVTYEGDLLSRHQHRGHHRQRPGVERQPALPLRSGQPLGHLRPGFSGGSLPGGPAGIGLPFQQFRHLAGGRALPVAGGADL